MTELSKKIIDFIKQEKTINEISLELGLSNKQLFSILTMLKNKGIDFQRKYYETGDIIYTARKTVEEITYPKEKALITNKGSNSLNAVVIADTHIGSIKENVTYLNQLYNYCTKKNIHIIFHCGDILDGTFGEAKKNYNGMEQVNSFLNVYPFDQNIINIAILGNHDFSLLEQDGIDFENVLNSYRHDFLTLGYHQGILKIKNDYLVLIHKKTTNQYSQEYLKNFENKKGNTLILEGHHHYMGLKVFHNSTHIYVPTLSNLKNPDFVTKASILQMALSFSKGQISSACFEERIVSKNFRKINEIYIDLLKGKNTSLNEIEYEEDRKQLIKTKG